MAAKNGVRIVFISAKNNGITLTKQPKWLVSRRTIQQQDEQRWRKFEKKMGEKGLGTKKGLNLS
jgi:hypothetical protein